MLESYFGQMLCVGVGGFVGSCARFAVGGFVQKAVPGTFPVGTLAVNVAGSLAIGMLAAWLSEREPNEATRLLLMTGVLGGFTTFSAFSLETMHLFQRGEPGKAILSVIAQVVLGVVAAWLGFAALRRG